MKTKIIVLVLLFYQACSFCQNSFSRILEYPDDMEISSIKIYDIKGTDNGDFFVLGRVDFINVPNRPACIIHIDSNGNFLNFHIFSPPDQGLNFYPFFDYHYADNRHIVLLQRDVYNDSTYSFLCIMDFENEIYWCRQTTLSDLFGGGVTTLDNEKLIYTHYSSELPPLTFPNKIGLASANINSGAISWNRHYWPGLQDWDKYFLTDLKKVTDQQVSLIGQFYKGMKHGNFILQFSIDGFPIQSFGTENNNIEFYSHEYDSEGSIIISGRYEGAFNNGVANASSLILKLNSDFEVLWAKKIIAENFYYRDFQIKLLPNNDIFFIYSTNGNFPVISGEVSTEGELISYQGFAGYNPNVYIADDGSRYIATSDSGGNDPLLMKTDSTGVIDNCPNYSACVTLVDFDIEFEAWEWEYEDVDPLPMVDPVVASGTLSTSPFCYNPPAPEPDFLLPDSVCVQTCLEPLELKNQLANYSEFRISGPDIDTLFTDTSFYFCFPEPGIYTFSQELWVLGCPYYYDRELVVLPDLEISLDADSLVCEDLPFDLGVNSSRPLQSYLWSDGSTESFLPITLDGNYAVRVSDGYCDANDSIQLELLALQLSQPVFEIHSDTIICEANLPMMLEVSSPYSQTFSIPQLQADGNRFQLDEAGSYTIFTEIQGCTFSTNFTLHTDPCLGKIFLPNIFTPNDDGLNDWYEAFGPDIEVQNMMIFDRWGGTLFESREAPIQWDGTQNGKPVNPGVYIVIVEYINLLTGETKRATRDVVLMR